VVVHGLDGEKQLRGDLRVGLLGADQVENLVLAPGQPERPLPGGRVRAGRDRPGAEHPQALPDDLGGGSGAQADDDAEGLAQSLLLRREALSIVNGLGAHSAAQIIRQRLRVLGARSIPVGPRAATRERPFGLTRREYEVLDLICAEHTNAEIAAKLFLSVKTVDHHVSAVLGKLGVPTRAAARRAVRSA